MKTRLLKLALIAVVIGAVMTIWGFSFVNANNLKYRPIQEIYPSGEAVDIGKNYFDDQAENPEGYTVTLKSARVLTFKDYIEEHDDPNAAAKLIEGGDNLNMYVYDVELTIRNDNNTDGAIHIGRYTLYDKSLMLPIHEYLWELHTPHIQGSSVFSVKPGTEVTVQVPFAAMLGNWETNSKKADSMILNDKFYLGVSSYPVKKLISVDNVNYDKVR